MRREVRVHGRGRQILTGRGLALLLAAALLSSCAASGRRDEASIFDRPASTSSEKDTGSCRPWFVSPSRDWGEGAARHSCWNLAWEIPVALVAVPLALGLVTAPVWVPIALLR